MSGASPCHQFAIISAPFSSLNVLSEETKKKSVFSETRPSNPSEFLTLSSVIVVYPSRALQDLRALLPPHVMLPDRRLEVLLSQALELQLQRCTFFNSSRQVSLLADLSASRDDMPTEVLAVLADHRDEVWFAEFSGDGRLLATASRDRTVIIYHMRGERFASDTAFRILCEASVLVQCVVSREDKRIRTTALRIHLTMSTSIKNRTSVLLTGPADFVKLHTLVHDAAVSFMAFEPNSARLITTSHVRTRR